MSLRSPTAYGHPLDFDADCDVDGNDADLLEACVAGPGAPRSTGCEGKDLYQDNDVDQANVAVFQCFYSGEGVPADAGCVN